MFTLLTNRILDNLQVSNHIKDFYNIFKLITYDSHVYRQDTEKKILLIYENVEYWEPIPKFMIKSRYAYLFSNKFGNIKVGSKQFCNYLAFNIKNYNLIDIIDQYNYNQINNFEFTFYENEINSFDFESKIFNVLEMKFTIKNDVLFDEIIKPLRKIKNKISKIEICMKYKLKMPSVVYKI